LRRLGMSEVAASAIEIDDMLPAVAQGAIGIERREADARAGEMLAAIHDGPTGIRLAAERAFLAALDGSCETPIAGLAVIDGERLYLRGEILKTDGSAAFEDSREGALVDGPEMGRDLAKDLLSRAGDGFFDWR